LARHIIDDVEDPEASAISHLIVNKVQGPASIELGFHEDRCPHAHGPPPGASLADGKALFAIEPVDAIDPGGLALAAQEDEQVPIAEPPSFIGQIAQSRP
jgi:hypothetical protein